MPALTLDVFPTLLDRKIRCDRGFPACSNCTRTNRDCQGYGVRLSWPREHDRKRFIIGPVPPKAGREHGSRSKNGHAVHTTAWDMEVYRNLTEARMFGKSKTPLPSFISLSSMPSTMTTSEVELLHFCAPLLPLAFPLLFSRRLIVRLAAVESCVSGTLTTFGEEPVGSFILRIALSGNSLSIVAVQQAILALSYLFRYGAGLQAEKLKLSGLRALITSAGNGMSSEDAVQHVAAGMILCLFEVSHFLRRLMNRWSKKPVFLTNRENRSAIPPSHPGNGCGISREPRMSSPTHQVQPFQSRTEAPALLIGHITTKSSLGLAFAIGGLGCQGQVEARVISGSFVLARGRWMRLSLHALRSEKGTGFWSYYPTYARLYSRHPTRGAKPKPTRRTSKRLSGGCSAVKTSARPYLIVLLGYGRIGVAL